VERPSPTTVTLREPKLLLSSLEIDRLRGILDNAPGPTNLDRTKYRSVDGPRGTRLVWRAYGDVVWQKLLKEEGGLLGPTYLMIGLHCYALAFAENRLLVWRQIRRLPPANVLRMSLFDTTSLTPIGRFPRGRPGDPVFYKSGLLAEVDLPGTWAAGPQTLPFPVPMHTIPELLLLVQTFPGWSSTRTRRALKAHRLPAIYVVRPARGEVEVFVLQWARSFEGMWHWIARLARDPASGNIVGDGPGMKLFVLDSRARFLGWIVPPRGGR